MRVIGFILKCFGWTLLGLLALLILALFVPVSIIPRYGEGRFTVRLRLLGLTVSLYDSEGPRKQRRKKPKKTAQEPEVIHAEEPVEKAAKKIDWATVRGMLNPARGALGIILRGLRVRDLQIRLIAGGRDAAEVGKNTGRWWEVIGGGLALLNQIWYVRVDELNVVPDFLGEHKGEEALSVRITGMAATFVAAGVVFLARYIRHKRNTAKAQRAENPQVKESTDNECKSA